MRRVRKRLPMPAIISRPLTQLTSDRIGRLSAVLPRNWPDQAGQTYPVLFAHVINRVSTPFVLDLSTESRSTMSFTRRTSK